MGLLHGSSLYSPAAPAGNVTGCTAEDVGKNLHRRSDVYGKHTPGNYGCGCATPGTERNKHCKNNSNMPLLKEMKGAQATLGMVTPRQSHIQDANLCAFYVKCFWING